MLRIPKEKPYIPSEAKMEKDFKNKITIIDLPDEIISLILNNSAYNDIISFGLTSKHFFNIVFNDKYLWKSKCIEMLSKSIFKTVQENNCDGNWLNELKKFIELKKNVISQLLYMSPDFYRRVDHFTLEDVKEFFTIATKNELSYYYTIHILQQVVQKAYKNLDNYVCEKPYTLTEIYYAKIVLRYLMHTFLCIKWVKLHSEQLMPESVINFCVQWIDPTNFYTDESINNVLNEIVEDVKDVIRQARVKKPPLPGRKKVTDREVLSAMKQVLYGQRHIALTPSADLDNLNIVKVINNKCGHAIALAVIYQAVARKCGVKIELIAFPNHLFLEWLDDTEPQNSNLYTISLETGELKPKRRCPFSQTNQRSNYLYCPDSLLQYIYSSYFITMGAIRNWNTQNAMHLMNFLGTNQNYENPYKNFFSYLIETPGIRAPDKSLDINYVSQFYRQLILTLSALNKPNESVYHNVVPKKHDNNVMYAVGMICYHKNYEYICIIRGWDLNGDHVEINVNNLHFGRKQPFYRVIAADQSERYVAQENLIELTRPNRLYHLEDQISKEFSHFDGFAYVLNDEKKIEYPDEAPIIEMYRSRS